jgi:GH35 family endo-1,4-beta-xylanase
MGDLGIKVTDVLGKPIEGATVDIRMTRHAYPFGTAIASARIADGELWKYRDHIERDTFLADNVRYREKLKELFNFVVFENSMKWPQWVGERGYPAQKWTLETLDWLQDNDFLIKGHTMVWASWNLVPEILRQYEDSPEALQRAILSHIRDLGQASRGATAYFDVLNEPMSHNALIKIVGMERVAEWFKVAREVQPDTRLVLNDFDLLGNGGNAKRRKEFIAFVEELQTNGAPIDMIGFQSHFWSPRLTSPESIWSIIDEFDQALGLPLMVSEFDMNLNDEQLQADYTADFLKAWFAHPATEAYIMWGFWGGAHWMRDPGAMIRRDWTEKPNLKAYTDLVFGEWWTELSETSDAEGSVAARAFYGDYEIVVSLPDGRSVDRTWHHAQGSESNLEIQVPQQTEF